MQFYCYNMKLHKIDLRIKIKLTSIRKVLQWVWTASRKFRNRPAGNASWPLISSHRTNTRNDVRMWDGGSPLYFLRTKKLINYVAGPVVISHIAALHPNIQVPFLPNKSIIFTHPPFIIFERWRHSRNLLRRNDTILLAFEKISVKIKYDISN